MNTQRCSLILVLSLLAIISATSAVTYGRRGTKLGGYSPIQNLNDPHVQDIAKYAVQTHNKQGGSNLEYVSIVKGESQVVAGTNYRLEISAKDGGNTGDYEAVVYERVWESYRNLTSFKAV